MTHVERTTHRLLLLLCTITFVTTQNCYSSQIYTIKSVVDGLAVDASNPESVQLEYFDGNPPQQWKFECGRKPGLFHIVNYATGNYLDVTRDSYNYAIMSAPDGTLYQEWTLNANGTIVNAGREQMLAIYDEYFVPGSRLWTYSWKTTYTQMFSLHEKVLPKWHKETYIEITYQLSLSQQQSRNVNSQFVRTAGNLD